MNSSGGYVYVLYGEDAFDRDEPHQTLKDRMRSLPAGIDQRSPARHPDWLGPDDLSLKVQEVREATDYQIPIQLKLGAARVYDDVRMAAKCGPDIIYLDGAEGGTGAGPHVRTQADRNSLEGRAGGAPGAARRVATSCSG